MAGSAELLARWLTFYEIVGCSGGALVGLQFVVIALIASNGRRANADAISAFGTPNVVHFAAVLGISAIISAPWPSMFQASVAMISSGIVGLGYSIAICRRAGYQTAYKPVLEDWIFYAVLPCVIYAVLIFAGWLLQRTDLLGLFLVAGSTLSLLLIGVRNSWDSVTHIVSSGGTVDADK